MTTNDVTVRLATPADVDALTALVRTSMRELSLGYSAEQIEAVLRYVRVDRELMEAGHYFAAEHAGEIVAAGGWMRPAADAQGETALLRLFMVHPAWVRRGLARRIYAACEEDARRHGVRRFELYATPAGEPLYRALGFRERERIVDRLPDGTEIPAARMEREI